METAPSTAPPAVTTDDRAPERIFHETERAFARAMAGAGGVRELFIDLAGLKISLQCVGDSLLPRIGATLAHLRVPAPASVDFTIRCWNARATGQVPRLPPQPVLDETDYGCLKRLTDLRFRTFYLGWAGILCTVDLDSNIAYSCYLHGEPLSMYEVSGPLRGVFGAILNRNGMHLVHASALGTPRGTLLFAGPPGSGKSTLAITCLQAGLCYQSDDLCVITSGKEPKSLSLYSIAKLREDALPRFTALHPILSHFEEEEERKAYFYVHQHFPAQVLKEAPIRAIVLPRITGEPASRLTRAAPLDAVRGVIAWSIKEIPRSDRQGERIMLQVISRLPAYHLYLGREDESTLAIIRSLLDE